MVFVRLGLLQRTLLLWLALVVNGVLIVSSYLSRVNITLVIGPIRLAGGPKPPGS